MGKTALLDRVDAAARDLGFSVLRGCAPPGGAAEPWSLLGDLVEPLLTAGATLRGSQPATTAGLAAALGRLVVTSARTAPVLVVIDDLQWADAESVAALSLASSRWHDTRVAIVAAWRGRGPLDDRLGHWRLLPLGPLPDCDAARLLQASTRVPVPRSRALALARLLGCCPLALVECDRVLSPEQVAGTAPLPDPVPLHEHLRAAWSATVDGLPPRTRAALVVTCVLTTTRLDLLAATLAAEGLDLADLDPATRQGLLSWPGPGRVGRAPATCGPLLVSAVRGRVPRQEIRRLHVQATEAAHRLGLPPAVTVRHLRAAAGPGDETLATALEQEAERARVHDLPGVAVQAWRAAADVSTDPEARSRRALHAARGWLTECTTADGGPDLAHTLAGLDLPPSERVWRDWVRAEALAGTDLASSATALASAARRAREGAPDLVGPLLLSTTVTAWLAGDPDLGLQASEQLRQWQQDRPDLGGLPAWAGEALVGVAHLQAGRPEEGAAAVRSAWAQAGTWTFDDITPVHLLVHVVTLDDILLLPGEGPDARLDELARRLVEDDAAALAGVRLAQAWRARRRGDWARARLWLEEGHALARAVRASAQEMSGLALLTELDALCGDADLADHLDELRARSARVGDRLGAAHAERAAGLALLASGQPEQAAAPLEAAAGAPCLGRGLADAPLGAAVDLVEALVQAGDVPAARVQWARLEPVLAAHPDPAAGPAAYRCRGLLAGEDAPAALGLALSAMGPRAEPFDRARTELLLGEQLRRARQRTRARRVLEAAAARFDRLGARPWAARAERELRAAGAAPRPDVTDAAVAELTSLTPQERRVALAVADGASTREAAQALVLSPRTVEFHLANAYRKLGVTNRAGLARAVRAAGPGEHREMLLP
jgi:DNA-binding CsgD family transcriptional regulator